MIKEKIAERDYYDILNVSRNATQAEIKSAFRQLAKQNHPDRAKTNKKRREKRLRELMAAYKVLGNKRERARYDAINQTITRDYQKQRDLEISKKEQKALYLLSLLLQNKGDEALELYNEMQKQGFPLEKHLNERDYLDCIFLIGEQMEQYERYEEAAEIYEYLFHREDHPHKKRYFFEELEERLKRLYSRVLPILENKTLNQKLHYYEKALDFNMNRGEKAFILKKIAETYLEHNQTKKAEQYFKEALELCPDLKGTSYLESELEDG